MLARLLNISNEVTDVHTVFFFGHAKFREEITDVWSINIWPGREKKFITMLRQHSQYDSRLGFSFRVFVRVRVGLG